MTKRAALIRPLFCYLHPRNLESLIDNDAGSITGMVRDAVCKNVARAFIHNNGAMTDLGTLVDPALSALLEVGTDVNSNGQIVPGSLGQGGIDRTVTNLLGAEPTLTSGEGFAINSVTMGSGPSAMIANGNRVFLAISLLP